MSSSSSSSSSHRGVQNPGPLQQCDAMRDEEDLMLDHLEKSTGRLYQSGLVLKDEARVHNQLLDGRGCLFVCLFACLFVCLFSVDVYTYPYVK